ncbi:hypothetical protein PROFUN_16509 [Planoprotostelium fungivorum]|uniref:Uncharacterized protein n=1 Tax=Planoprotostelium fungivorum TaxID=1890364 RepID=A0A2P6MQC2_9EUKA|nr:hypothetical protein PROFUN_16509 [Planoprotostelium fungivorum]
MHRDKRQRTVPNLTEYLLSIWLDPSTTSNSIEGLYRSASRHNVFKLEFTIDDIRIFLSHQLTYKRHLGFNLQYKQQKHTVVHRPMNKQGQTVARALDYIFRTKISNKAYNLSITPKGVIIGNKTIKQKIAQYTSVYRTQRYIDALKLITENYNHSYHHTISRGDFSKNKINSTKLVKAASGVVYHRKYYHWQLQRQ